MGQHLSVYHIKKQLAESISDDYIPLVNPAKHVDEVIPYFELRATDTPFEAHLFIERTEPKPPPWQQFLEQGFSNLPSLSVQTENSVLFVKLPNEKEIFAFTFGQGRFLLRQNSYEEEYGLRVALNVIYAKKVTSYDEPSPDAPLVTLEDPGQYPARLKSVSTKKSGVNPMLIIRQTDRRTTFETFEVDTYTDNLLRVTGRPVKAGYWNKQITGSDSLSASPVSVTFQDLGKYCRSILENRGTDCYKEHFNWIDNRRSVIDSHTIEELDYILVFGMRNRSEEMVLTVPEVVDWEDVAEVAFVFDGQRESIDPYNEYAASILETYDLMKRTDNFNSKEDVEILKGWEIIVKYSDGTERDFSFYDCLSGEIKLPHDAIRTYIFSDGKYYEVNNDYVTGLNKYLTSIDQYQYELPHSNKGETEGDYNERIAGVDPDLLLLDKKTVMISNHTSSIEICDLLSDKRCFIHVKRKLRSSSLSHLFSQGKVSADLLRSNSEFRSKTLEKITEQADEKAHVAGTPPCVDKFCTFKPEEINPSDYEVTYAVIADWGGKPFVDALPFFSKVNLRTQVETVRRLGFKVSYACVDVQ